MDNAISLYFLHSLYDCLSHIRIDDIRELVKELTDDKIIINRLSFNT